MSNTMKASVFVSKLKDVAQNYKTLYVMGCFGAPLTAANKKRYTSNHDYNKQAARTKMIQAASEDTFGFDCVCLLKGILWGWCGDKSKGYGGAGYAINDVPDIGADQMIKVCSGVSTDFSNIQVGEALWCSGHIGVYIGDGLGVECTPAWKNKVQITAVGNIGAKSGYNTRKWTKHGKLPYIEYDVAGSSAPAVQAPKPTATVTITPGYVSTGSAADEKTIWSYLFSKIGNEYGVAGLMGNLYAESGLRSNNLQGSYEKKLGHTDASYTAAVDNGTYDNFVRDSAGYGLWQLTYWSRKEGFLKYARSKGRSIGDLEVQLEYLMIELGQYGLVDALRNAKSVLESSNLILLKFEKPASMNDPATQSKRASYGQKYFNAYAGGKAASTPAAPAPSTGGSVKVDYAQKFDKTLAGAYKVTAEGGLNIRAGCSTSKASLGVLPFGTIVRNYGYYSVAANGVKWLYLKTDTGVIGFSSSNFLERA